MLTNQHQIFNWWPAKPNWQEESDQKKGEQMKKKGRYAVNGSVNGSGNTEEKVIQTI